MSKALFLIIPLLLLTDFMFSIPTTGQSVVTNIASISGYGVPPGLTTNVTFTVGSYFGVSPFYTVTNQYNTFPSYNLKIPFSITNLGNDADSNLTLTVTFLSNNAGYTGSNWNVSIEILSTDVGSNYTVPFAQFGEGAILSGNILVFIPVVCPDSSTGDLILEALTVSNTSHPVAFYTGFNGTQYGGYSDASNSFSVTVFKPNSIIALSANDSFDTITLFDGTKTLRKLKTTYWFSFRIPQLCRMFICGMT